ncbi:hypothetical protein MLP_07270 [Microlunatus phosphovorus NM-1]|uniref:DUF202 domain-containing protein n=1 Tax=Microlunatus phosphovorus (strain ATCC 700054 / DSM 10555 / JCM 9379 / NBRC 101784 / NCIMB 13414 / VKM Ac-1990 / NM-1) TaxID=1032480 RepID=F5XL53_MICPN|nr:DUF202 domain-containing protein [Microlunatus phosphovorus]BAK33741.1 hypothetical protein MLP_07270 [Microlunatus phosphovorus NM-1]
MSIEPTMPAERTRLAWTRTTLAGVVCLLGVLRLLAEVSVPLVAAVGIALLIAGALVAGVRIRSRVQRRQLTTETAVGRNAALLTTVASLACLSAMAYVILV